jgi:hypothetical protein
MALLFANNANSTLAADITNTATTLTVITGEGALFPNPTSGNTFMVTVKSSTGVYEIMSCTARTSDTLTVVRAQEGTTAVSFSSGAYIGNHFTAGSIAGFNTYSMATNSEALTGTSTNLIMNPANTKYVIDNNVPTGILLAANNLSDLTSASSSRTNLGLGNAAVLTAGTSANNLVQLNSSGQLPAVSGSLLTGLPSVTSTDLGMMNAFLSWRYMPKSSGSIPKGYMNTFQTDELATKTNAYYDSATKGYRTWASGSGGNGYTYDTTDAAGYTVFDRAYAVPNNAIIDTIGVYNNAATTIVLKIALENSTTSYTVVSSTSVSHTGSGWEYFTVSYTVPSSGTYRLGAWSSSGILAKTSVARAFYNGNATGTVTVTSDTNQTPVLAVTYHYATTNITLRPSAVTTGSTPSSATIYAVMYPVDTVTLSSDIQVRISRDGGSTWTSLASFSQLCTYDSTSKLLSATIDLTGTTAGTSVIWEISTYNTKRLYIYGVGYILTM